MILASLKPYYYYLIGERKKTIEVRKSALKNLPQDIVFYMSKDEKSFAKIPKEFQEKYREHFGKVGIRAVVDKIGKMKMTIDDFGNLILLSSSAKWNFNHWLSNDELDSYLGDKTGYGWHLDNVAVYDKPKKLSNFRKPLDRVWGSYCNDYCDRGCISFGSTDYSCNDYWNWEKGLTRPPQSWQYVEEKK